MQITIYHNPTCGTSCNALAAIRAAGYEPEIFEYMRMPLSRSAIAALVARMNIPVRALVRAKEPLFRELGLAEKDVTEGDLLDAMAENPILINRPIVVVQDGANLKALLCRPSALVNSLLGQESSAS